MSRLRDKESPALDWSSKEQTAQILALGQSKTLMKIADMCFDICVLDVSDSTLKDKERNCIDLCIEKHHLTLSMCMMQDDLLSQRQSSNARDLVIARHKYMVKHLVENEK